MNKRVVAAVVAAGLVGTGVGAVAVTPASAETSDDPVVSRLAGIKSALSGLVDDGTITQAQADKVAQELADQPPARGGPGHWGGPGGGWFAAGQDVWAAAAKALGVSEDDLRQQLQDGKSLADVASARHVSEDAVVAAMVKAAQTDLAAAVKDGKLTQARADEIGKDLPTRIKDAVEGKWPGRGQGWGAGDWRGGRPGPGWGPRGQSDS